MHDLLVLFFIFWNAVVARSDLASDWLDNSAPGIVMEYKVHIDAGKEDCYWQYVHPDATIYVNMQVSL